MRPLSALKSHARAALWLAGALACVGYYWLRTRPFPHRTAVGVERRLFGVGDADPLTLEESPDGALRKFTLSWDAPVPSSLPLNRPSEWPYWLYESVRGRLVAGPRGSRPALSPLPLEGTWLLEGDRLRYRWRITSAWLDERHLGGENYDERLGPKGYWVFDLATNRTYRGEMALAKARQFESAEEEGTDFPTSTPQLAPVSPALDDLDGRSLESAVVKVLTSGNSAFHWAGVNDFSTDLVAATTSEPFRSLILSPRSAWISMSRDERTLFLLKADGLWRLDLRKPIDELLREVTVPELPLEGILTEQ